ncbi:UNVERIFIED_CONTAM: hypothetical protein HHA_457060 [Hammondia hammondi]|eukprot:XP_008888981.1 hypothetical protein HHA_457060 [Hammondia hammondi]
MVHSLDCVSTSWAKQGDEVLSMFSVDRSSGRGFPGVALAHSWLFLYPCMFVSGTMGEGEGEASASADSQGTSTLFAHAQAQDRGEGEREWRSGWPPGVDEGSQAGPPLARQQVDPRLAPSARGLVPGGSQASAPGDAGVSPLFSEELDDEFIQELMLWIEGMLQTDLQSYRPRPYMSSSQ